MSIWRDRYCFLKPALSNGKPVDVFLKEKSRNLLPEGEMGYVSKLINDFIDAGLVEASAEAPKPKKKKQEKEGIEEKVDE